MGLSLRKGGNICFYPHEEIIRFVNKYVRKRKSVSGFKNIMPLPPEEWNNFKSLDLGCGMGRHIKFLNEFGLNPYGIDLSKEAIELGKNWFQSEGLNQLCERMEVGSVEHLPYENETFWICVSHGTLDSMPREIARKGMDEAIRVLKSGALMYLDLIMDNSKGDRDEIVGSGYEKDTIQSYFTIGAINELIGKRAEIKELKIITWRYENSGECDKRAHIVIQKR